MWILGQPHILTGRFCQDKYRLTGLVGYFYSKRFLFEWVYVNLLEIPPAKIDNLCATSMCCRFSQFIMRHIPGKEILIYYKEKNLERWPIFFFQIMFQGGNVHTGTLLYPSLHRSNPDCSHDCNYHSLIALMSLHTF